MKSVKRIKPLLFLDSGAHSLYSLYMRGPSIDRPDFSYCDTQDFSDYLDAYGQFVVEHHNNLAIAVSVDVIFSPERSWDVQLELEKRFGRLFLPVYHYGEDIKWLKKYIDRGYDYIGIGGFGQGITKAMYLEHMRPMVALLKTVPHVRTHGFAITAWDIMAMYPWTSVDSTTYLRHAMYGRIMLPRGKHTKKGFEFTAQPPMLVDISCGSQHRTSSLVWNGLVHEEKKYILDLVELAGLEVVDGRCPELEHSTSARTIFNMVMFILYCAQLKHDVRPTPYFSGSFACERVEPFHTVMPKELRGILLTYFELHNKKQRLAKSEATPAKTGTVTRFTTIMNDTYPIVSTKEIAASDSSKSIERAAQAQDTREDTLGI